MEAVETIREGGLVARLFQDEDAPKPSYSDQFGTLVTWHRNYCFEEDGTKRFGEPSDFLLEAKRKGWIYLLVGMLDHSGITLYEGGQAHGMDPGGWDSGQVGFIYGSRERFIKYVDMRPVRWRVRGLELLRAELKEWDQYVTGDVWGYTVETVDGEHYDSCSGFYDYDYALGEMKQALAHCVKGEQEAEAMENLSFAL
jgi:hypothetical protein